MQDKHHKLTNVAKKHKKCVSEIVNKPGARSNTANVARWCRMFYIMKLQPSSHPMTEADVVIHIGCEVCELAFNTTRTTRRGVM